MLIMVLGIGTTCFAANVPVSSSAPITTCTLYASKNTTVYTTKACSTPGASKTKDGTPSAYSASVYAKDTFKILKLENESIYIDYTTDSGSHRYGWIHLSDVTPFSLSNVQEAYAVEKIQNVYRKTNGTVFSDSYISPGDKVYILGKKDSEGYSQVVYETNTGWKMSWLKTSDVNNSIDWSCPIRKGSTYVYGQTVTIKNTTEFNSNVHKNVRLNWTVSDSSVARISVSSDTHTVTVTPLKNGTITLRATCKTAPFTSWCTLKTEVSSVVSSNYTIKFNANGGSGAPSSIVKTGTSSSISMGDISSTIPTRDGYTFYGWAASQSWSSKRIAYSTSKGGTTATDGTTAKITSSSWSYANYCSYTGGSSASKTLNLYAQWIPSSSSTYYSVYTGVNYKNSGLSSARIKCINRAVKLATITWKCPNDFPTWKSSSGAYNKVVSTDGTKSTSFKKGKTYMGIPYSMNDNSYTDSKWSSLVNKGFKTSYMSVNYSGRTNTTAHGIDCSYLVYLCHKAADTGVGISYKTTYQMLSASYYKKKANISSIKGGDIFLKKGHVMLFVGKNGTKYGVIEANANDSRVKYNEYSASALSSYGVYKFTGFND